MAMPNAEAMEMATKTHMVDPLTVACPAADSANAGAAVMALTAAMARERPTIFFMSEFTSVNC
jgi:hypothetical protein